MKRKTRLILLTIIGTMIILLIALGFSYAYMKGLIGDGAKSSLSVNNCAKILLTESGSSINLSNTYPMSDNAGLNTTPYTFGIRSTCSGNRGFKLYIVTIAGNTLSANNVKYALTLKGSKEILTSGNIGSLSSGSSDFNTAATNQLSSKVGTVDSIYYTYEDNIDLGEVTYYDLYMWVDGDATNSVANQTFTAAVTVLEGDYNDSDIAIRLAGDITTYDANVSCSGATGAKWNPLNRSVEVFDISQKQTRCTVTTNINTNLGNLKDIVEAAGYLEDGIPSDYIKIGQSGYSGSAPTDSFYTTSFDSSITSGDSDPDATLTFDTTNNMWTTSNLTRSRYYYYFFNVASAGTYQFCWNQVTGNNNAIYVYNGTTYIAYITVTNSNEMCRVIGDLETTDVIKIVQYTGGSVANVSSMKFGFKKSSSTTNAGYRYEGEAPNNYVWFNNEPWRIIGSIPTKIDSGGTTTTTNLVKIIRNKPIGGLVWNKTTPIPDWNTSTLYTLLNSYYYGARNATGNTYCYSYQTTAKAKCDYREIGINPTEYYGRMIKEVYWNTGASLSENTSQVAYIDEIVVQTMKGNVGIMNISDYGFASSYNRPIRTAMNLYNDANYTGNDWLYGQGSEWTITVSPTYADNATYIVASGYLHTTNVYSNNVVRPVVYLDSSVYVVSGDGTILNPYKLGM